MKKALFYRLFGVGKLPANAVTALDGEGILLSDEGLKGSVTYRNFHRPGKYAGFQRVGLVASIAITNKRMAAYTGNAAVIDVELSDPRIKQIVLSVEPNGALLIAFDASLFHGDWSGTIEYRINTMLARRITDKVLLART